MRLATYKYENNEYVGIIEEDRIYQLENQDMMDVIINGIKKTDIKIDLDDVDLLAPIKYPKQDVICLGLNYLEHAKESAKFKNEQFEKRADAVYFSKRVNEATGPNAGINAHRDICDSLDYEVELAVIIGKDCLNVSETDALDYVFGYTILNDFSARNIQNKHKQWYFGKSLDGFTAMGPAILTMDELDEIELDIKSYVNGELRQSSNTKNMIFDIPFVISELSKGMTLKAGTIISTGTPSGVGMGFNPPKFLKKGDVVTCVIERIGVLENTIL